MVFKKLHKVYIAKVVLKIFNTKNSIQIKINKLDPEVKLFLIKNIKINSIKLAIY